MRSRLSGRPRVGARILVADDDPIIREAVGMHLASLGHGVTLVASGPEAMQALHAETFDVALLDIVMPSPDGLEVLRSLGEEPDPPSVIVTTGQGGIDSAVHALRLGAFAYLAKPFRMPELDLVVVRAMEQRRLEHQNLALRQRAPGALLPVEFITDYAPLRAVVTAALKAAAGEAPVLIVGERGTGKSALARAMHARSSRGTRAFREMDARVLGGKGAARALFGGTRASGGALPKAALSSRGTVFLRDVLALGPREQVRLGEALGAGEFGTSGDAGRGGALRPVRARIIAAANAAPSSRQAQLSPELAAAFDSAVVELPPLRDRLVDVPALAKAFLDRAADAERWRLADDAVDVMCAYAWPGNVAELRVVLERGRLVARGGVISAADLGLVPGPRQDSLNAVERRHIASVLDGCGWHQGHAAETLGISPKTLYRKIREYGLRRPTEVLTQ